jgi:hypothetical protein
MTPTTIDVADERYRKLVDLDENFAWLLIDAMNCPTTARDFCAMEAYERTFKQRIVDIAGHRRAYGGPRELSQSDAYETTIRVIQNALPACRGNCICGESREAS